MSIDVGILILAGGVGRRFGGYKTVYNVDSKTLIEVLLDRLPSSDIYISIRYPWQEELIRKRVENYRVKFIYDDLECGYGPICGVVEASKILTHKYLMVFGSDTIPAKHLVTIMLDILESSGLPTLIGSKDFLEPMPAIYTLEDVKILSKFIKMIGSNVKEFRSTDLIRICRRVNIIDFDRLKPPIVNINFKEDLIRLRDIDSIHVKYHLVDKVLPGEIYLKFLEKVSLDLLRDGCEYLKLELREYKTLGYLNVSNHVASDLDRVCSI